MRPRKMMVAKVCSCKPAVEAVAALALPGLLTSEVWAAVGTTSALCCLAVNQWSENGGPNQLVRFEPRADGWFVLRFKHSGKVLDVYAASQADGADGMCC